jgi:hypothetical protein
MVVYSVVPLVCAAAYTHLATYLNDLEGHRTERQRTNALTLKVGESPLFLSSLPGHIYVCV